MSIYRWALPDDDQETVSLVIPRDCLKVGAVEFTLEGVHLKEMLPDPEGGLVEFPVVHIWDDPSRSPQLQRLGLVRADEDISELLRLWEQTRLEQFYRHLFRDYNSMQVVYLVPPHGEITHFNHEGEFHQGWKIEMVAAIFGGFIPSLEAWSFGKQPKVIVPTKPKLRLV